MLFVVFLTFLIFENHLSRKLHVVERNGPKFDYSSDEFRPLCPGSANTVNKFGHG